MPGRVCHRTEGPVVILLAALAMALAGSVHAPWWEVFGAIATLTASGPVLGDLSDTSEGFMRRFLRWPNRLLLRLGFKPMVIRHRGPTHSIVIGAGLAWLLSHGVGTLLPELAPLVFWSAFVCFGSHPVLDLLNTESVAILWPLPELLILAVRLIRALTGARVSGLIGALAALKRIGPPFGNLFPQRTLREKRLEIAIPIVTMATGAVFAIPVLRVAALAALAALSAPAWHRVVG